MPGLQYLNIVELFGCNLIQTLDINEIKAKTFFSQKKKKKADLVMPNSFAKLFQFPNCLCWGKMQKENIKSQKCFNLKHIFGRHFI